MAMSSTQITQNGSDGPLLFVFLGFAFLFAALLLPFGGRIGIPRPEALHQVTGTVLEVRRTQAPKGPPQIHIDIREGKSIYHLTQDDFGRDATGMRRVRVGDSVIAYVQPDFLMNRHWLWGLEREGQTLISYQEVLREKQRFATHLDSIAYGSVAVGAIFLLVGGLLRWRYGFGK